MAILGSALFDVHNIDQASLELEGSVAQVKGKSGKIGSFEDVNGDGYLDLMAFFSIHQLATEGALSYATTSLGVTANLYDGTAIVGIDSVNVVPP